MKAEEGRRVPGSGSLFYSDGLWNAAVYMADGSKVRRRRITREEAEQALAELVLRTTVGPLYLGHQRRGGAVRLIRKRASLSAKMRWLVLERDGFRCRYCGARAPEVRLHVDHVVPIATGGTDALDNLAAACAECNFGKGRAALALQ